MRYGKFIRMTAAFLLAAAFLVSCGKESSAPVPGTNPEQKEDPEDPFIKEDDDDPSADVKATFDYSELRKIGHPRLLMKAADFDDLRAQLKAGSNPWLTKTSDFAISLADTYIKEGEKLQYVLDASQKRLLDMSRLALKRLFAYSYAYKVTGDDKYLTGAMADLITVCGFKDWHPGHYLDVAEMSLGVAIAYDWLYSDLPSSLKLKVRKALTDYALKTLPDQNYFIGTINNWNQVCCGSLTAVALALYEKDKALCSTTVEKCVESNRAAMRAIYGEDGNYPEGYSYWGYGTAYQTIMLQVLQKAFGSSADLEKQVGFTKTAGFMQFMIGPDDKPFPYADGGSSKQVVQPAMWWFAAAQKNPSYALQDMQMFDRGDYNHHRLMPFIPCVIKDINLDASASLPKDEIWVGYGPIPVAMVHTGWKGDDKDFYVAIKGGQAYYTHGHMDAGSFVYVADGVRWSKDFVNPDYATMEVKLAPYGFNYFTMTQNSFRWDITKLNNIAHSTISCRNSDGSVKDKVHVTDHNVNGSANIEEVYDKPERLGAKLSMTGPLSDAVQEAYRTITLENRSYLKIVDEITAKPGMDAVVEWRMLTQASCSAASDKITLSRSGKKLYLYTEASTGKSVDYRVWPSTRAADWADRDFDDKPSESLPGFTYTVPAGTKVTFTTILTSTQK